MHAQIFAGIIIFANEAIAHLLGLNSRVPPNGRTHARTHKGEFIGTNRSAGPIIQKEAHKPLKNSEKHPNEGPLELIEEL